MASMGDEALIGRVLDDRYVIGERIARGGMASVFIATDKRLDRVVAVKVMHSGLGDDRQFTDRFVREARSAAKLNHPNVVAVFDQGSDGDVTYLVMEYVPGQTLRDVMREEAPMSPRRALGLMEQVLIALSAAHAARIIHRDVKPENVLITPNGEIKVADFGLARAVSAATTATGGTLIGTVSYLAPEIVVNEGADARSDVYACGAVLYEMLTGLKPHAGESPIQVAYMHVHEDVAKPSAIIAGIPPYVDALVARTTARNRDQRSADAHVMLQQVRQVQSALDAGLANDPDLTQDLLPSATRASASVDADTTDHPYLHTGGGGGETTEVVHTASMGAATAVVGGNGASGTAEATMVAERGLMPNVSPDARRGLQPAMNPAQYKQAKQSQTKSRRGLILLIAALILALLAGFGGWYYGIGRYVDTPKLVGLAEATAETEATSAGFTFTVEGREFNETVPKGDVIATDPAAGDKILPEGNINAVVSDGKERYAIPDLKGKTVEEATVALQKLHLLVGKTSQKYDEKVDKGDVVGTGLDTDTLVKRDTEVDLILSKGRQPVEVVDYTGKDAGNAQKALEKAGFKVDVKRAYNDTVGQGKVISQDPKSGTKFKGDTITLTASLGPEFIAVPNVVGKLANEAEKILKNAGFKVKRQFGIPGNPRVQSTSPSGKARAGSTITINFIAF